MPTYEYKCDACGTMFEKFQSITSAPVRQCVKCGKRKVKRLISTGAGLLFKGSGFYITDYRTQSYKDSAKSEAPAAPAAADSKSAPADTATAKASDSKPSASAPSESKSSASKPAEPKPAASTSAKKK